MLTKVFSNVKHSHSKRCLIGFWVDNLASLEDRLSCGAIVLDDLLIGGVEGDSGLLLVFIILPLWGKVVRLCELCWSVVVGMGLITSGITTCIV